MEVLRRRRGSEKAKITRVQNFIDKVVDLEARPEEVITRHEVLQAAWQEYNKIHGQILEIIEEEALDDLENEYANTEENFCKAESRLKELSRKLEVLSLTNSTSTTTSTTDASDSTNGRNSTPSVSTDVKLPRLELPVFSGDYLEWSSFHVLFVSVIHENTTISAAQKLYYLKGAVRNEAATLLHSIDVTEANYTTAWNLLKDRYQNERQLVQNHLTALFRQRSLSNESATGIQQLLDNCVKHVRALNTLGLPTDQWDSVLVYLLSDRLDSEKRRQWELSIPGKTLPTFAALKTFLEQRCRALQATTSCRPTRHTSAKTTNSFISTPSTCCICSAEHSIYRCPELVKADNKTRIDLIRGKSLCFNCLRVGHASKQCTSNSKCRKCGGRHHTLIHFEKTSTAANGTAELAVQPVVSHVSDVKFLGQVLLATAIVKIVDSKGMIQLCRALIDSGSQATFITDACVKKLRLRRSRANVPVHGIGSKGIGSTHGAVTFCIQSCSSAFTFPTQALVLPRLTTELPTATFETHQWTYLQGLPLADPQFSKRGKIDILLGADVFSAILMDGKISGPPGCPTAHNTQLGWIVCGRMGSQQSDHLQVFITSLDLNDHLKRFWEVEEMQPCSSYTSEEQQCEEFFCNNHSRDSQGRYTVSLPIKQDGQSLGQSKEMAIKRLLSVENRLEKLPDQKRQYREFMQEYISLGHMEMVDKCSTNVNYLPHHFVLKESSSTTSLRVVFDASAPTSTGISLNDKLLVGPKLQDDITDILLRFRLYKYAYTADIAKMYRQIRVSKEDSDLQRILWRESTSQPIQEYRLLTVTYGTASAPYLAIKVLQHLAISEGESCPLAKMATLNDFYVDNLMSGGDNIKEALQLQGQLIEMMHRGGFHLRKWAANHPDLLMAVPAEDREKTSSLNIGYPDEIQTLGLSWNPVSDHLSFVTRLSDTPALSNKRSVLSDTARVFDPLGWISPITVKARILLQQMWTSGLSWDEPLPTPFKEEWSEFRKSLLDLHQLKVTRCVVTSKTSSHQLHGFSDASEKAYGAVVYLRSEDPDGTVQVHLLCSRTKVAPVKRISLPRLELCAAVLLASLLSKVSLKLKLKLVDMRAWCDSTVTLSWISAQPNKWKTFVANRVASIQSHLAPEKWSYVPSEINPADLASRGVSPRKLVSSTLWWNGPNFLCRNSAEWPSWKNSNVNSAGVRQELKPIICNAATSNNVEFNLLTRFSKLSKLNYVIAYCFRFVGNARKSKDERCKGPISKQELNEALMFCIKLAQQEGFPDVNPSDPQANVKQLNSLCPFIDDAGILRVGGRLGKSPLHYDQRHPILLPKAHHLTTLIISSEHLRLLHAGPQLLLASLQQRYWIIGGRNAVRHHVFKCLKCYRDRATVMQQQMGDSPKHRVEPARPFLHCGMDYGGPLTVKSWKGRGGKLVKCYVCLFVCFATKAVHLELVSDATTEACIAAMRRFTARRGRPSDIYSDNGSNFIGANKELKELHQLAKSEKYTELVTHHLASEGIAWHYNPPKAPHFGGLWEAGIKSMKRHLRRIVGTVALTYEEMCTVLSQIEACLNSRPISPISADPNDLQALTPGHFLIGEPLTSIPDPNLLHLSMNRLSRWQLVQRLSQHFWKRWRMEYLAQLQQRPKWQMKTPNISINDLVLVKEDGAQPLNWPMGRIINVHPGKDGHVRVVTVRTSNGTYKRPLIKLCLLPMDK